MRSTTIIRLMAGLCLLLFGCRPSVSPPLHQRAYVWQREWTAAVSEAVKIASPKLAGFVVFGADISWRNNQPRTLRCNIDWQALQSLHQPVSIAMRIAPWPGPFNDDSITRELVNQATALLSRAKQEDVPCDEFQVDFDCAQKKLAGYSLWLKALGKAVKPARFVITTLPAWLDEEAFPRLLNQVDGWVLQVHSALPDKAAAQVSTCDPERARRWVSKAGKLRRPFEVALSTYSAQAGYDSDGKQIGLALDGIQPAWPAGTRIMQFDSDADALTKLVAEWQLQRPAGMRGVLWYRLPVATDQRNWKWPTFAAVIEGRTPAHRLTVHTEGTSLVDLELINEGEAEEPLNAIQVVVLWQGASLTASEALPNWEVKVNAGEARFVFAGSPTQRLSPGTHRVMGWLRFNQPASLHVEIIR